MSTGDSSDEEPESPADSATESGDDAESVTDANDVRERIEQSRDRAVEGFDEGVVDLLSWVLETETRARIYVHLRKHPDSTSEEIADGTGLYPSTVREALAELHEEGTVEREKRESSGAGNNPYEYRAIAPSALVRGAVEDIQTSLNDVFQLDRYMGGEDTSDEEPVTITVEAEDEDEDDDAAEWVEPGGATEATEAVSESDEETNDEGEADESSGEGESSEAGESTDEGESSEDVDDEATDEEQDEDSEEEQDEDIDESL